MAGHNRRGHDLVLLLLPLLLLLLLGLGVLLAATRIVAVRQVAEAVVASTRREEARGGMSLHEADRLASRGEAQRRDGEERVV